MTETQQRFLRSIAERVPLEHVVELHLFPPIRQGGVETGVAVVAEDPRRSAGDADLAPAETDTRASDDPVAEILTADADSEVLTDESAEASELVATADTLVETVRRARSRTATRTDRTLTRPATRSTRRGIG